MGSKQTYLHGLLCLFYFSVRSQLKGLENKAIKLVWLSCLLGIPFFYKCSTKKLTIVLHDERKKRTLFTDVIELLVTSSGNQPRFFMAQYEAKPNGAFDGRGTVIWKICRRRRVLVPTKVMVFVPASKEGVSRTMKPTWNKQTKKQRWNNQCWILIN